MRSVSVSYHGMLNSEMFKLHEKVSFKNELSIESDFYQNLKRFMCETNLVCSSVYVHNQEYKNGDLVVIDMDDYDNICVGLVQTILIKGTCVFFVVQKC